MNSGDNNQLGKKSEQYDTSTNDEFFDYYHEQSDSEGTFERFQRIVDLIVKAMAETHGSGPFRIADVGGGAGTLARIFSRAGHQVTCIDISRDLLEVGQKRAEEEGLEMQFINCSATNIPLPDACLDICVVPELLEHVVDWQPVLDEASRVLRPGGLLYLSTTNRLCPVQEEFTLPLYSWYPAVLKRRYEHLALTTRPEIANYAKYPAVHWFTYYQLRKALRERDFDQFLDRLDMIEVRVEGTTQAKVASVLKRVPFFRFLVQIITDGSYITAFKAGKA